MTILKRSLPTILSIRRDVLGNEKSIIDALVIKTIYTILEEAGAKNLVVSINSIGDKESRSCLYSRTGELLQKTFE